MENWIHRRCLPGVAAAALVLALALALAACGGGGSSSSGSGNTGGEATEAVTTTASSSEAGLAEAEKSLQTVYEGAGFKEPPSTSPKPAAGKSVWVIDTGLASPSSAIWGEAAKEAGEELGWKVKLFDGEFNPAKWLEGVQEAVAAHASGIVLIAVECGPIKAGLEQAHAAGVKVVAIQTADCNEAEPNAKPLFDATVKYEPGDGSLKALVEAIDFAQADWITVNTEAKAKIIIFESNQLLVLKWQDEAFAERIAEVCPECEVVDSIEFTVADLTGPKLRQELEQALLQNPEANAVVAPFDDIIVSSGGDAAIRASGRSEEIAVVGATGLGPSFKEIESGEGLDATVTVPFVWEGWAAMDTLNRVFAGEPAANSGISIGLVDKEHPPTNSSEYVPPVDFKAAYRKAWGVG